MLGTLCAIVCFAGVASAEAQDGRALAQEWCAACHLFPEPRLLDKRTWTEYVLPDMGARLGFHVFRGQPFQANPNAPVGTYRTEPLIAQFEWDRIVEWYETTAPAQLPLPTAQIPTALNLFDIEMPKRQALDFPTNTAIHIDEATRQILVGDSYDVDLDYYSDDLRQLGEIRTGGTVSRIMAAPGGGYLATTMGGTIGQSEAPQGMLIRVDEKAPFLTRLARQLHRPVDLAFGDFNDDSLTDYVVAEFGAYTGKLSLYLGHSDGTLQRTVLLDEAGAIAVSVVGRDLYALIAQGNERIIRLDDFASGQPGKLQTIARFAPSYGSTSLRTHDFDGDGVMDLIYTAGDNADISAIFKPYHGIYLFAGDEDGTFNKAGFFPLDGAYGTVAGDFDQDGDIDIGAVSYFPRTDRDLDKGSFVYLENVAGRFEPRYVAGIGDLGRFAAITAGDVDGDGDQDIALSNLAFGPVGPMTISPERRDQWINGARFVLLRNTLFQD